VRYEEEGIEGLKTRAGRGRLMIHHRHNLLGGRIRARGLSVLGTCYGRGQDNQ
jgi:hypothetical protein